MDKLVPHLAGDLWVSWPMSFSFDLVFFGVSPCFCHLLHTHTQTHLATSHSSIITWFSVTHTHTPCPAAANWLIGCSLTINALSPQSAFVRSSVVQPVSPCSLPGLLPLHYLDFGLYLVVFVSFSSCTEVVILVCFGFAVFHVSRHVSLPYCFS